MSLEKLRDALVPEVHQEEFGGPERSLGHIFPPAPDQDAVTVGMYVIDV